jgi:hypothetical protein
MSKAAGKPKNAVWRKATRKGERVLIDPAGHVYHGTAQEVRDAALSPSKRDMLADRLLWRRHWAHRFKYTPDQCADAIRDARMEAISLRNVKTDRQQIPMGEADYILLNAGARMLGLSERDYWAEVIDAQKAALLDMAERETGKREIPLTRHERAALARLARV